MFNFLIINYNFFFKPFFKSNTLKHSIFCCFNFFVNWRQEIFSFKLDQFLFKPYNEEENKSMDFFPLNDEFEETEEFIFNMDDEESIKLLYPDFDWKYYLISMQSILYKFIPLTSLKQKKFFKKTLFTLQSTLNIFNKFRNVCFLLNLITKRITLKKLFFNKLFFVNNKFLTNENYLIQKNDIIRFNILKPLIVYWLKINHQSYRYMYDICNNSFFFKDWEISYLNNSLTKLNNFRYFLLISNVALYLRLFNWRTYNWKSSKTLFL